MELGPEPLTVLSPPADAVADGCAVEMAALLLGHLESVCASDDRLGALMRHALLPGGKLLRPLLLLESVAALGGDPGAALPAAAALEMLHAATLVHDDIIDQDALRRGRPSVAARFGQADALVGGDAMMCAALGQARALASSGYGADRALRVLEVISTAAIEVSRGQMMEADLAGRMDCAMAQYLRMVRLKTGALLDAATRTAAVLTGAEPSHARALARFSDHLGVAFQMQDDLLPYTDDGRAAGKPALSDLRNRRPTLPVLIAFADAAPRQRLLLQDLWRRPAEDAQHALAELLEAGGALGAARATAADHLAVALAALEELPPGCHRDHLAAMAARLAARRS
ncbi:putative polyprenyl synthetase [Actinacidiphila reveromycinica]|uniref:Putative polyprenyl synthetase n=1 Tax=Actinacidiphila reveromycinica TaxID=659352 RepID=A0A7U3UPR6_9ACTN|nr:polyprenyl synthetase family protein [Streptomyces sp. SN-593]BBA96473.1 putative polyprenyl synthetase [Streptomyces sp. SN-593]